MFRLLLCICCVVLVGSDARADALSEEVPVPGGTRALAQALGLDATPDRALFITELTRVIYDNPAATTSARLAALTSYLQSARVDGQTETVPLSLSRSTWNKVVFQRPVEIGELFSAVITDRRAAHLAHGLASLDDETLQFVDERPDLLERFYRRDFAAFALFAGSLRIRRNAVDLPGGDAAAGLWEALVDEAPSRAERFIRQLFSRDGGRIAYLYDAASRFDEPSRAFLLGQWITDAERRVERLQSLRKALAEFPGWTMPERSFRRPLNDPVLMLMGVPVDPGGTPAGPSEQALWSDVFDRPGLESGPIDAAWLAEAILGAELQTRRDRLDQVAFGLRVFSAGDGREGPERENVILVLRAFPRYRMLLLSLERMGMSRPAAYAAAVRHADRLATLNARDGFTALSQFQGSLAMLVRLVGNGVLDSPAAETLVVTLCKLPLNNDGRYAGGVARWIQNALVPTLGIEASEVDQGLIASLSGASSRRAGPSPPVHLENGDYRLDLVVPEMRRTRLWLARLGVEPVSRALAIAGIAEKLQASSRTSNETRAAIDAVRSLAGTRDWEPRGGDNPERVAQSIDELADEVLGDSLLAITYAVNMEAPVGAFAGGNLSRRHDFGLSASPDALRTRLAWAEPKQQIQAGVPWHVTGSLLGLDLGLSRLALRRISSATLPGAPVLADGEKDVFTKTVTLMNASRLTDADRDRIAGAIARGRARLITIAADGSNWEDVADEIGLDGARRRAVRWTLAHDRSRLLSFFSLTELLHLGMPQGIAGEFDAWGVAADAYDGCLCTRLTRPGLVELIAGRWPPETVATEVADLNLRIAIALAEMKLPAALARGILAAATQDFVDRVKPLYPYDWLTLIREAQALTNERIEDYVAALAADGPLVPDVQENGASR